METANALFPIAIFLFGMTIGAVVTWVLAMRFERRGHQALHERAQTLQSLLDAVTQERDTASIQYRELKEELIMARGELQRAIAQNENVEAIARERERALEDKLAEIQVFSDKAQRQLADQFSSVGSKIYQDAQKQFLDLAEKQFNTAGQQGEERLKRLLSPVDGAMRQYREQVERVEKERASSYGDLKSLMDQMRLGQQQVRDEAQNLVNSLRNAPKARGQWGERQLRNVLEVCGLSEYSDFQTEVSKDSDGGRLRPDVIINIPGGKQLIVDAKVSLNAYQDAFNASDDKEREYFMVAHTRSMRNHVDTLAKKEYWKQFEEAPDFVIMFVGGEHFLSAALDHDPHLWEYAFDNRILLATPTNLVAIARTISGVWRQEKLAKEAKNIGLLGKEMYDRLLVASGHLQKVGKGLNGAVSSYNQFVSSFERRLMPTGRKFAQLNVETGGKELDAIPFVEQSAVAGEVDDIGGVDGNGDNIAALGQLQDEKDKRSERETLLAVESGSDRLGNNP